MDPELKPTASRAPAGGASRSVAAGRVGRAHGLDGSFHVTGARARLLAVGTQVTLGGRASVVERLAGAEDRPIVRLAGIEDRTAAQAVRGLELTVDRADAPELAAQEWWASELEGCEVRDGERVVGVVRRLLELPSCEALEVDLHAHGRGGEERERSMLVPMVRDAIRSVDVSAKQIDVDMSFVEED